MPAHSRESLLLQLRRVEAELDQLRTMLRSYDANPNPDEISTDWIRAILGARRRREAILGREIFAYPSWDMLLELYAARLGTERVTVGDLCTAAAVASSTGVRWIGELEKVGFIVRVPDEEDRRRAFIELSERGLAAMHAYFREPRSVDTASSS